MNGPEVPTEHPPQSVYEAFEAFRTAMEARDAAYRVTVRYFDRTAGRTITYEASLWGEVEGDAS